MHVLCECALCQPCYTAIMLSDALHYTARIIQQRFVAVQEEFPVGGQDCPRCLKDRVAPGQPVQEPAELGTINCPAT